MSFTLRLSATVLFLCTFLSNMVQAQNSLNFDGSNDYVQTSFAGVMGKANRTFEAWVNVDTTASGNITIVDYGLNAVGSRNTFSVSGTNQLIFISGGTNANISSPSNAVPSGKWTHVAFVLNNETGYLYVNGKQVGTGSLSTVNTPTGNTNVRIGQRVPGGSIPFKGSIDEVRIWDVARTATEISNNMGTEFCETDSHLVAYHKFNQGIAGKNNTREDESFDLSSRENDGDLTNFTLTGTTSNWITGYNMTVGELYGADTLSKCGKFKSPSGKVFTSSGKYTDTIDSYMGCDSIITFNLTVIPNPTKTINATSCRVYISPSGQKSWNTSGVYTDVLPNPNGCDTIVTVNLIVSKRSRDTAYVSHCGAYTSPSGKYTWDTTGQYADTLVSIYNCDSIVTFYFTQQQSRSTIYPVVCNSYTSPSGKYVWTQSGLYYDTIANSLGCDSFISIDLKVNQTLFNSITEFRCTSYSAPSGKYEYTTSGIYSDTITASAGCDSILTIALTIGQSSASISPIACDAFISPSGKIWNTSGAYVDTIKNTVGCDSVLFIALTINQTSRGQASLAGCESVASPSGRYLYTTSGTYSDTIFRQAQCDSVIEVEVTIDELQRPEIIRADEQTIESSISGDAYRWLDCENDFEEVAGATAQSFEPSSTIEYAVEVSKGTCVDTSDCYLYMSVQAPNAQSLIKVFPNPVSAFLTLDIPNSDELVTVRIIDVNGKVQLVSTHANNNGIDVSRLQGGIYTLEIVTLHTVAYKSFIKE